MNGRGIPTPGRGPGFRHVRSLGHQRQRHQGVGMLRWNGEGRLVSFTVLVRPLCRLEKLIELMGRQLAAGQT